MRRKLRWDEIAGILLMIVSLGMLGISVYLCAGSDIWYDELFSMGLGNQSLGSLVSITARDVHPPLYYIFLKIALGFAGEGYARQVTAAKLLSCLPFFLCLCLAVTRVRKYFGLLAAGLFSFLVLSMPRLADYTVEIRMYGFALLFVTACMLYAYELALNAGMADKKKTWVALTVCALAACYTHYYACMAAFMVYLYLFVCFWQKKALRKQIRPFMISGFFCAAGYLPWILLAVRRQLGSVKENYWIEAVSWRTLGGCVKFLFQPSFENGLLNTLLAIVFFCIYGILIIFVLTGLLRRKGQEDKSLFVLGGAAVLAGLAVFGIVASLLVRPIFVYRYMLPALGVFWLGFAVGVSTLRKKSLVIPLLLLLVVTGTRNYRAFYGEEMWKRLQMEQALDKLGELEAEDVVIFNFVQAQGVVNYYIDKDSFLWYEETEELIQEMFPKDRTLVEGEFSDEAGIQRIWELLDQGKRLWFFGSGAAREEILEKWSQAGIEADAPMEAMIERYWFNLYRIH